MKKLVQYSAETQLAPAFRNGGHFLELVQELVNEWLGGKGSISESRNTISLLRDGKSREASITWKTTESSAGKIIRMSLSEPVDRGRFKTDLSYGYYNNIAGFSAKLSIGLSEFNPRPFIVRCPKVVRSLYAIEGANWSYQSAEAIDKVLLFVDTPEKTEKLIDSIWSPQRMLPFVLISMADDGAKSKLPEMIQADLIGLAHIAILSSEASWEISRTHGKEWSCYGNAIRILWPHLSSGSNPLNHPLWLLRHTADAQDKQLSESRLLVSRIRSRVFTQSSYSSLDPTFFLPLKAEHKACEIQRLKSARESNILEEQALEELEVALREIEDRDQRIEELEEDNKRLLDIVRQLRLSQAWSSDSAGEDEQDLSPESEVPPETLEDAVSLARVRFEGLLIFGNDVEKTIEQLRPNAGPPEKVYRCLKALGEAADLIRTQGSLGQKPEVWLKSRTGIEVTGEAQLDSTHPKAVASRTFDDGVNGSRVFGLHFKPTNNTSPDRCVRIYFEWHKEMEVFLIGCVGRHP